MNPKVVNAIAIISAAAVLVLLLIDAALTGYVLVGNDRREELHDRVIAAEQTATDWERAYGKLLERVGGADVPNVPLRIPPKPGNKGSE